LIKAADSNEKSLQAKWKNGQENILLKKLPLKVIKKRKCKKKHVY